jgi:hypothetical protein
MLRDSSSDSLAIIEFILSVISSSATSPVNATTVAAAAISPLPLPDQEGDFRSISYRQEI